MIRKNSNWKFDSFFLSPSGKDFLWGGTRLEEEFGKELDLTPLAETRECSTHPDGPSIVANGIYKTNTQQFKPKQKVTKYLFYRPQTREKHPSTWVSAVEQYTRTDRKKTESVLHSLSSFLDNH